MYTILMNITNNKFSIKRVDDYYQSKKLRTVAFNGVGCDLVNATLNNWWIKSGKPTPEMKFNLANN